MGLPDIQQTESPLKIHINQVGVENVKVPFMLESRYGGFMEMVANVAMRTSLDPEIKGISMSRFHISLDKYLRKPLKQFLIRNILQDLRETQHSENSYITFKFNLPKIKRSPISNYEFPLYYSCGFEGQLRGNEFRFFQYVRVQYASYCPCSAELSKCLENSSGYPHAQRSFANVIIEQKENEYVWLEDIIDNIEDAVKTTPYPIIKRVDEQEIAKIAYQNTMFVEDAIRRIYDKLENNKQLKYFYIKCIHEESIHTSEAIAIAYKGDSFGTDPKMNLMSF